MQDKDNIKTVGYVLKRTNYGEADRILNIITPLGKFAAIAKGSRKEKSKLAGGIELFSLTDFNLRKGKSEFYLITSAKMKKYYGNILKDFTVLQNASVILKKINSVSGIENNETFFNLVNESLDALDDGVSNEVVETWFLFNFLMAIGEEINLYRDALGMKLDVAEKYVWDCSEKAFRKERNGNIGADEIKIMRIMVTSKLKLVLRIKRVQDRIPELLMIARSFNA